MGSRRLYVRRLDASLDFLLDFSGLSVLDFLIPGTKGSHPMNSTTPTEAQASADDLLTIYGTPKSRETLRALLAVAFSRGALAAATEALEASQRA